MGGLGAGQEGGVTREFHLDFGHTYPLSDKLHTVDGDGKQKKLQRKMAWHVQNYTKSRCVKIVKCLSCIKKKDLHLCRRLPLKVLQPPQHQF